MPTYQNNAPPFRSLVLLGMLGLSLSVFAAGRSDEDQLLDKSEYRGKLEEVVVVGRQPEWRTSSAEDQQWRPGKFELSEPENSGRLEWFPEYSKDERDNYQGVRDRTGEKPEFKIFEWKF